MFKPILSKLSNTRPLRGALLIAATAVLASCGGGGGGGGFAIPASAHQHLQGMTPDQLIPRTKTATTMKTFDTYCRKTSGNRSKGRQLLLKNGYFLMGHGRENNLDMYAHRDGRPLVAYGNNADGRICMTMVKRDPRLGPSIGPFVKRRHKGAVDIGTLTVDGDTAENVWAVPGNPSLVYMVISMNEPGLGPVQALGLYME